MESGRASGRLLSEMPAGAVHYRIVALCFLAWIFDFYDLILYSFLLVPVARELKLSDVDSSLALGVSFLMTAAGGALFGFFGDRFGRKPVIVASVVIYGIGTLLCAASRSLIELLVYRSFTGLGIGGEWASGQSLVAESVPPRHRARYSAYVQTGAPLGVLLAAATSAYVEPLVGWRIAFALSAAPALVVALAVWRWLPESDVWKQGRGRLRRAIAWDAFSPHRRILALLFVVLLINSEAYWFTYSWMPGYLEVTRGLSLGLSGRLMIGMQAGALLGYASFGVIADRFGRRPAFFSFALIMALGLLPPTILWNWAARWAWLTPTAMAAAGFGTGLWSGAAPMVSELLPTRIRNAALGLLLNVTRGLQFFTPLAITLLSARVGFGPTLALGALFSAAGGTMVWLLPETRGRSITEMDDVQGELPSG